MGALTTDQFHDPLSTGSPIGDAEEYTVCALDQFSSIQYPVSTFIQCQSNSPPTCFPHFSSMELNLCLCIYSLLKQNRASWWVASVAHVYAFQSPPSVLVDMWGGWWWCGCCCLALGTESSALLIFVNHFLTNNTANRRKIRG